MFLFFIYGSVVSTTVSVRYIGKTYIIVPDTFDSSAAARGIFIDNLNQTGWHDLHIESHSGLDDFVQAYAAGMVEGYLSRPFFKSHLRNVVSDLCTIIACEGGADSGGLQPIPKDVRSWFAQNLKWVEEQVDDSKTEFYWAASVILEQLKGMVAGFNDTSLTLDDLWLYHCRSEIYDVYRKLRGISAKQNPLLERRGTFFVNHFTNNGKSINLSVGHSAWRAYGDSMKLSKRYRMLFRSAFSMSDRRSLSGYPMLLHSDEGMTINGNQLIISATSIAVADDSLYAHISSQGFPHWFRAMIADYVAFSGDEWAKLYNGVSAGSCGVEWIIVDTKRFVYDEGLMTNTVTVVDEIPGKIKSADVTEVLKKSKVFASYDVPYDTEIFGLAGYETIAQTEPEFYSYNESSRAKILKARADGKELDTNTFKYLARFNDPNDSIQNGRVDLGISPRQEINKDGAVGHVRCAGGTDAKFTSVGRALHLAWEGAAGPFFDGNQLPKFKFSDSDVCKNVSHEMLPDELAFKWVAHYFDIDV